MLARLRSFLRAALGRRQFERDMDAELRFHLNARVADLVERGLPRPDAERQARIEFGGDLLRWKEDGREARGLALIDQAIADARYGFRWLARQPAFACAVISTLALAIAANTTFFALADAAVFRPLPFADADRLVWVTSVRSDNPAAPFTLPEFIDYRARARGVSGLAAYANWSANVAGEGVTERFQGARFSANTFDVLGVQAAAGRLLTEADDRADAPRVVVISHRLWQQRFGGAADIVGRQIRVNGEPVTVVGVLPIHFPWPLPGIDMIAPLAPDRDPLRHVRSSTNFLRFVGRLAPGVTAEHARAELTAICLQLRDEFPNDYTRKVAAGVSPLADAVVGDLGATLLVLFVSVVVVLSAAVANVVCLALIRTNDRRAEMALRAAIGASRARLTRQVTVEALSVTILAGVIGVGLAALATSSVTHWAPASMPRLSEVRLDVQAVLFAASLAMAATMLLTLAPAAALWRTRPDQALRLASRGSSGDRWNRRVRNGLVVAEVAAALVLLLSTALVGREFARLQRVNPGFTPDAVFQARVSLPQAYRTPEDLWRFHDRLMDGLALMPGLRHAGLISSAPLSGVLATVPFSVVGADQSQERGRRPSTNYRVITPGYLDATGTRLRRGRGLSERDRTGTVPVALVSDALATQYLGDSPLGRQIAIDDNNTGPRAVEVVGVVDNVRLTSVSGAAELALYIPLSQIHPDGVGFVRTNQFWMVRSDRGPEGLEPAFVKALQAADRDAAVSGIGTMRQGLDAWFAPRRFSLSVFVAFAIAAVLLAASGLYGLMSYAVSQRRREIGVRMALGASVGHVRWLVLGHAAGLALAGIAAGLGLTTVARPLARWLPGDAVIDPATTVVSAAILFAVVMLAVAFPARQAARVAPTVALRD